MKTSRSIRGGRLGHSREVDFGIHQIRILLFVLGQAQKAQV